MVQASAPTPRRARSRWRWVAIAPRGVACEECQIRRAARAWGYRRVASLHTLEVTVTALAPAARKPWHVTCGLHVPGTPAAVLLHSLLMPDASFVTGVARRVDFPRVKSADPPKYITRHLLSEAARQQD